MEQHPQSAQQEAPWRPLLESMRSEILRQGEVIQTILEIVLGQALPTLQYKTEWPTEAGLWYWVDGTRQGEFDHRIMRTERLGDEIVVRDGGSSHRKKDWGDFWSFAGPISQYPEGWED